MKSLSQRYARALVDVALEKKIAEQVRTELSEFAMLVLDSADLRNFLASPAVPRAQKSALIEKIAVRMGASETLKNFLLVLVDNRRTSELDEMVVAYQEQLYTRLGIADVYVTSAQELNDAQKNEMTGALELLTKKKVSAQYWVDPELIGGAVVRIGSTIYDGSVRQQLERLRAQLASE